MNDQDQYQEADSGMLSLCNAAAVAGAMCMAAILGLTTGDASVIGDKAGCAYFSMTGPTPPTQDQTDAMSWAAQTAARSLGATGMDYLTRTGDLSAAADAGDGIQPSSPDEHVFQWNPLDNDEYDPPDDDGICAAFNAMLGPDGDVQTLMTKLMNDRLAKGPKALSVVRIIADGRQLAALAQLRGRK